jgi:GTP-binding protein
MAFIDEMDLTAKAGDGGDGVVRWLHLKSKEWSGPAGGNGGNGGDVYFRAVRDIERLSRYRGEKFFRASDGGPGEGRTRHGKNGADLYIDVPIGSVIENHTTGERFELLEEGQVQLALKGGRGGAGNAVFKSSVNRSPEQAFPGTAGEEGEFHIELRLIADAGLVGLPNAGKTTLLNTLTNAGAKTGAYAFTTLEPNLGMLHGYVLADIPGLIEGAAEGKGLGSKFLRHIARTKMLLHCVSLESEFPMRDYETVRGELAAWGEGLDDKPEHILLTKSDTRESEAIESIRKDFESLGREVHVVSAIDDTLVKYLGDTIVAALRKSE